MYISLVVTLVCSGISLSWAAASQSAAVARLEGAGGTLFIAGLSLIGLGLPLVQHFGHR